MKIRTALGLSGVLYFGFCAALIWDAVSGSCGTQGCVWDSLGSFVSAAHAAEESTIDPQVQPEEAAQPEPISQVDPALVENLSAINSRRQTVVLGELYDTVERFEDADHFKFAIELTTQGAAISKVTLSEFDDRDPYEPQPLVLQESLSNGRTVHPMANGALYAAPAGAETFGGTSFPLEKLDWELVESSTVHAKFQAIVGRVIDEEGVKMLAPAVTQITKTYRIRPGSYDVQCEVYVENLLDGAVQTKLELIGPGGINREDSRMEGRKVISGFLTSDGNVTSAAKQIDSGFFGKFTGKMGLKDSTKAFEAALKKGSALDREAAHQAMQVGSNLEKKHRDADLLWTAVTNKYFAAVLEPVSQSVQTAPDWVSEAYGWYWDPLPTADRKEREEAHNVRVTMDLKPVSLAPAGDEGSGRNFEFKLFFGPKDRDLFRTHPDYVQSGFLYLIDMRSCFCCPSLIIRPLAFGVMWLMKTMYSLMGPLGNYGVVIMILVFLVRLVLHPVTKKSQVTMMKLQKLGPQIQEVQKKYSSNPGEMRKKMAEVYDQAGLTQFAPATGMMPMFLQMPIWIALWTAVYTSIELRGAGFLPFWITDLSAPDALIRFGREGFTIPLLGWNVASLNILPLLMGVVMYMQQKLMPHSNPQAEARPEIAQQQKIMMIMMPLLFPLMFYNGPSGVNLYIMSSIAAGVVEQTVIRKHLREQQAEREKAYVPVTKKTGGRVKKKKPKPFFRDH